MLYLILHGAITVFAVIGVIEVLNLIFHKARCKSVKTVIYTILPLKGELSDAEYVLRSVRSELCWLKNGSGRLIVPDVGLDEKTKETIGKLQGVELFKKEELYPLFEEELWKKNSTS